MKQYLATLYEYVVDHRTGSGWRLPALDGLRGIAAMMVLTAHVRHAATHEVDDWWWAPIERGGLGGVILFFALSGFLLYLPWLRSQLERRPAPTLKTYALRRCLRIMPAYYASVVLLSLLRVLVGGREPISPAAVALHFAFLPTLGMPLVTVYWTLQVEEFFYWLLPLLHRFIRAAGALVALATACVVAGGWSAAGLSLLAPQHWELWLEQTPFFLPAFVLGIVMAIRWKVQSRISGRTLVIAGALAYVVASPIAMLAAHRDPAFIPVTGLLLAPAMCAIVLGAARGGVSFLEHPILRFIGGISFSIYLWHLVVIRIVPCPHAIANLFVPRLVFTIALTLPVALLSYLVVERPFLMLRPTSRGT